MKKLFKGRALFAMLATLCIFSFAAHLAVWPSLPEVVPSHWGADGTVDGESPKAAMLLFDLLPFGLLVMFQVLPSIDPRRESYRRSAKAWEIFQTVFTVFLVLVTWSTELSVWGVLQDRLLPSLVGGGLGALFLVIGNYLPQVRQNYTFGVKTPWALENEHCWQRTQRMGGICFMALGVLLAASAFWGSRVLFTVLVPGVVLLCVWCYLYSYLVYTGKMK